VDRIGDRSVPLVPCGAWRREGIFQRAIRRNRISSASLIDHASVLRVPVRGPHEEERQAYGKLWERTGGRVGRLGELALVISLGLASIIEG